MFVTPAFAQTAVGGGPAAFLQGIVPFVLVFVILYFLVLRPQQKRVKQHRDMIAALRRGDTVVTGGGLIGKIARVDNDEVLVDLAENVRVRVLRSTISEVRSKTEPVPADTAEKASRPARKAGKGPKAVATPEPVETETGERNRPD